MNVAFINPFIAAVHRVFDTMVHVPVTLGRPHLKNGRDTFIVSAAIGLSGPVEGTVELRLSQRTALALASGLTGSDLRVLDDDCLDAIGEIASIVCGNAKQDLAGRCTDITIPKVSLGAGKPPASAQPTIVIPCLTKIGDFSLEVRLIPSQAPAA